MARRRGEETARLVACVVPKGAPVSTQDLREHLLRTLPEYMVPSAFVSLEALPLTTERQGRPQGPARARRGPSGRAGDRGAAHRCRGEAGRDLARGPAASSASGVHDNFFELGGHSLLVAQLASRVRNAFGVELPLRTIFEAPTLAGLAARLDVSESGEPEALDAIPPRSRRSRGRSLCRCRSPRSGCGSSTSSSPGARSTTCPWRLRLRGRLRIDRFAGTFREIVRRHEALRTTFRSEDGRPVQVIEPEVVLEVPVTDLSHLSADEREIELARIAEEEARLPFDLRRAPLLRVRAVRLAAGETEDHAVLVTFHHIVSDGWSMGVLVHEVAALYGSAGGAARAAGAVRRLRGLAAGPAHGRMAGGGSSAYWKEALAGTSAVLDLPTDRPRPAVQSFRGAPPAG